MSPVPDESRALVPQLRQLPARWPLQLLGVLPRHLLSRVAGGLVRLRWPRPLQGWLNRGFVALFGVDADEAAEPIASYPSIQELFTRHLKPGARPVETEAGLLVSPVDGALGETGVADGDRLLQVKGKHYSLRELLGGGELAERFVGGAFATLYLSPRDYHRIHVPCAGQVVTARYLPGGLWPVNPRAVAHVDSLFARNERLVTFLDGEAGMLALVAVGATMVGRTVVEYDSLVTNPATRTLTERHYPDGMRLSRGEEIGRFEFGSTVVLVLEPGRGQFDAALPGATLRLGERIGVIQSGAEGAKA